MLGLNPRAAQRSGVSAVKVGGTALVVSGAFAGLAGGVLLTGEAAGDRVTTAFSGNYGWQGLLVALLARDRPLVAIPMALVFAALRTGSGFLAATGRGAADRRRRPGHARPGPPDPAGRRGHPRSPAGRHCGACRRDRDRDRDRRSRRRDLGRAVLVDPLRERLPPVRAVRPRRHRGVDGGAGRHAQHLTRGDDHRRRVRRSRRLLDLRQRVGRARVRGGGRAGRWPRCRPT